VSRTFAFEGRTALVTGAASGIGAALAEGLAERGAHLLLVDIDKAGLKRVAETASRPGLTVRTEALDLADRGAVEAFAAARIAAGEPLHLLFNNAGVALGGTFDRVSEADFDWLMEINFHAPVRLTRALLPVLEQSAPAQIVNTSSIFGIVAPPGQSAYSAAKFALRGFSNALRHELEAAGSGVGVTVVHPGGVATQIAESARMPADATNSEVSEGRERARRLLVMPPPEAAGIILRGVQRRKPRVLVGRDAHAMALLERIWPVGYWSKVDRIVGARAE
jgi:short-subunit dehydrogenase